MFLYMFYEKDPVMLPLLYILTNKEPTSTNQQLCFVEL